MNCNSSIEAQI